MKNTQPKMKAIKTGKGIGIILGCKDYTDNFKSEEVKITNKLHKEKSNCIISWSKIHWMYTSKNTSLDIKQKSKSKIKMRWVFDW